ncbi:MAG: hypothetical protein H6821_08940 [Planctomycetaceae bacterium]|nr:hypothetical protein [Planctomycetales bacterium]MCB9874288.1 hypothetical protein [Planctomycetaceae bacterium]
MLDRASTFAQPEIVELLKTRFVPVAIDQAYQRRQQDTEGEFYRKIAGQSPRGDFQATTQGFYIANAAGDLLLYNNNRDPEKVLRLMKEKLREFVSEQTVRGEIPPIHTAKVDPRYNVSPPAGGLVLRVHAKVLDGYKPTTDRWQHIFQTALSRDNLWVSEREHQSLVRGEFPNSLQQRVARFHLVDNTRGEPPIWEPTEIREVSVTLSDGSLGGKVQLANQRGNRGFDAELKGEIEVKAGQVVRFDMVCLGQFWGDGPYTRGAPVGRFPLAISFTLADGTDIADKVPPQGSRGWVEGYIRP